MQREMKEGGALRFQILQPSLLAQTPAAETAGWEKSVWEMKVQRESWLQRLLLCGSPILPLRGPTRKRSTYVGWGRGEEGGLRADSCLDNLSSEEQIRPTAFFGTNQAEEEKLEGEASLLVTAFANFLSAAFPSPLHLPVPNPTVYLSSVHSGILAPPKAARYCCKTPRMLLMNPLDKGKRGNPISG